jgi:hypothetical protein
VLRHPADLLGRERDRAGGRAQRAGEDLQQRRLAGAVRPDHGHALAGGDLERDVAQRLAGAVALGDALGAH